MHLLAISLFELGQFLRIFLWIFLPILILFALITTYIHYLKRPKKKEQDDPAPTFQFDGDNPAILARIFPDAEAHPEEGNTTYRGLLWLKNKYEQDREQSTAKYMQMKEEHRQLKDEFEELEYRYKKGKDQISASTEPLQSAMETVQAGTDCLRDQLAEKSLQVAFLQNQLDQRISKYHQLEHQGREAKERLAEWEARHPQTQELLNERAATIDRLREQLQQEILKTAEVKAKLQSGGNLLLKIQQEVDQLLTRDTTILMSKAGSGKPDNEVGQHVLPKTEEVIGLNIMIG